MLQPLKDDDVDEELDLSTINTGWGSFLKRLGYLSDSSSGVVRTRIAIAIHAVSRSVI